MKAEISNVEDRKTVEKNQWKKEPVLQKDHWIDKPSKMEKNKRNKLPVSGRSEMEDITIDLADMNTSNKEILKITLCK